MKRIPILAAVLLTTSLTLALPAAAQDQPAADPIGLRGDFSGTWFDPEKPGQGVMLEVLEGGRALVAWYTFDVEGRPLWLYGLGEIGTHSVQATLHRASGGRFPPAFDPSQITVTPWGEATLTFTGCDAGSFAWAPTEAGFSAGEMPLARITGLQGARCNLEESFAEQRSYHFERGPGDFKPLFADLPVDGQDIYELDFAHEVLPAPLESRRGLRLTGHNRSDDLAMLVVAPLGGLQPDTAYRVEMALELASDVPQGCAGIGGSPGDSVYVKLGVSSEEPRAVTVVEGEVPTLRLNVDFGNQAVGGESGRVVGTLANSGQCEDPQAHRWELKSLSTAGQRFNGRSDAQGRLWLLAGTDSAFEGLTNVYFTALRVRLDPVSDPQ